MCEMAAHYKMKYGLEGSEKSLTITSKRVSKIVDYSEDIRSSSTDKSLIGSLPKLLADNLDESKNDDDDDDDDDDNDIPCMIMHPPKKCLQPTLSLDRMDLQAESSHPPLRFSSSSVGTFSGSDSFSSDLLSNSITTPNGYLHSPASFKERTFNGNNDHPIIYENTDEVFNGT